MEEQFAELLTKHESLQLRVTALETALVNLVGFQIEKGDSSEQGRIKFQRPEQVEPEIRPEPTTTSETPAPTEPTEPTTTTEGKA